MLNLIPNYIMYFCDMKQCFLLLFICLNFNLKVFSQILINEYSAANYDTYTDNYGEYEDWIELYNTGLNAVDLNGWALSDKANNPLKWIFPSSLNIPAGGVVVVYCSGRDELTGGIAHTNFKITQTRGNEVLMLTDNNGLFQDSIRVLPNKQSHSRGRETNGSPTWSVFTTGTPNANNAGALLEYAETPIFSQSSGYYNGNITLSLSSSNPNNTIYYTTNGDEPDNTANVYSGPITISNTSVIKAITYSPQSNVPASFIDYHTFFINDTHTIPIMSISGDRVDNLLNGNAGLEPEGTIEWFDENGILIDKGSGEYNKHGNDSWAYDQRGFDFIMRDQFGYNNELKDKLFMTKDRDKFQRLIVKAAANDNYNFEDGAHIRDAYVHHLSQLADLRMDERSYSSCIVYVNGDYWGVYDVREKADDHDFTDYYYDQPSGQVDYLKTWGQTWSELPRVGPPASPVVLANWNTIENYITTNPMSVQANYNYAKSIFNTGSIIDYFLLNSYVVASDWLNWNTAWWRGLNPNGDKKKWRYCLWDMDATFDHYINYTGVPSTSTTADPCDPSSLGNPGNQGHVPIWNSLLENSEFHGDYINRWQDLSNGPLSCSFMVNLLDSMIGVIDPEMPRQISRWGGAGTSYADWQNNVNTLRNFILARCDSMNSGFVSCDTAITGIYNVTLEIIGTGEVKFSNINVNDISSPFSDERFGGISLPFEVVSGPFDRWEITSTTNYVYDPYVDTLVVDLQSDILVKAFFVPPTPTRDIVYNINTPGTTTSINANGVTINTFPTTINYFLGDTVTISPLIDPLYGFSSWVSDSVTLMPNPNNLIDSFYVTNHDNITLNLYLLPTINAFISGNDTICENDKNKAEVFVNFNGSPPYTFIYSINGISQPSITTTVNPYVIQTDTEGRYVLDYFSDITEVGGISGSAFVTILESPTANFKSDTISILDPTIKILDRSIPASVSDTTVDISSWSWSFGDGIGLSNEQNPTYTYSINNNADFYNSLLQVDLTIVDENGCSDTTSKIITISNEYLIYIPNSFTPDLDGKNDRFCIQHNGIRENTFLFNVHNRYGELVYSTDKITDLDCSNGWDGRSISSGELLPPGVYIYKIYYQDFQGWKYDDVSIITLVR